MQVARAWAQDHICQFVAIHAPINVSHTHAGAIRLRQKQIATNKTAAQLQLKSLETDFNKKSKLKSRYKLQFVLNQSQQGKLEITCTKNEYKAQVS